MTVNQFQRQDGLIDYKVQLIFFIPGARLLPLASPLIDQHFQPVQYGLAFRTA